MEFHLAGFDSGRASARAADPAIAETFAMTWSLTGATQRKRVVLFASRGAHCLLDLLWRWSIGELPMDVVAVVANHPDHERDVRAVRRSLPPHPGHEGDRARRRRQALDLFAGNVDLVVLARYMRILSSDFLQRIGAPVINIHHSFLPAFAGADPYLRAYERGVKLIGATAHYATEDLDEGPIIEQDVVRVSHSSGPEDLTRMGRDIERVVLARALHWHLEDRVIAYGNRTIVF